MDNMMVQARLREISNKITKYTSAKNEMENIKRDCVRKHESWKTDFKRLANNRELSQVKRKNVFEGNMADMLHTEVGDAISQIEKGIEKSEALEDALEKQIKRLERKILDLKAERQRLEQGVF